MAEKSKECKYIGHLFSAYDIKWRLYFFKICKIDYPIYKPYISLYIFEAFASIKIPAKRPSGFLFPLCISLNYNTILITSSKVVKVNL